jgi:hypothetical protein
MDADGFLAQLRVVRVLPWRSENTSFRAIPFAILQSIFFVFKDLCVKRAARRRSDIARARFDSLEESTTFREQSQGLERVREGAGDKKWWAKQGSNL